MTRSGFSRKQTATICAVLAFGATSAIAVAGADWPPPVGILGLEALLAVLAVAVYLRVSARLTARAQGRRTAAAALEGLAAGWAAGVVLVLMASPGEPDVSVTSLDNAIGFAVIGLLGALIAQALWALALCINRSPGTSRSR